MQNIVEIYCKMQIISNESYNICNNIITVSLISDICLNFYCQKSAIKFYESLQNYNYYLRADIKRIFR